MTFPPPATGRRRVAAYEYDNGDVDDSNLTRSTAMPDTSGGNDRVTDYFQDWRNRLVAAKAGVEDTESTDTNRPNIYTVYDNLNQGDVADSFRFSTSAPQCRPIAGLPLR